MNWDFEKYTDKSTRQDSPSDKFFNDATVSDSLIREFIQNSLDAVDNKAKPVRVVINQKQLKKNTLEFLFDDLKQHLSACGKSINDYNQNSIILEDFNTIGLKGDNKKRFFQADNITDKTKGGGSHGIGKAVFSSSSQLKAFLGYSLFKNHNRNDKIFQGRAVLKTHKINSDEFRPYGNLEIPDKEHPGLIAELFNRQKETGLSVAIPSCDINIKDLEQSCLRQFYIPIINKKLEIKVGNKQITNNTLSNYIDSSDCDTNGDIKNKVELVLDYNTAPDKEVTKYKIKDIDWKNMKFPQLENKSITNQNQALFIKCDIKLPVKDGPAEHGSIILLIKKLKEHNINNQEIDCWRDNLLINSALGYSQKEREYSAIMLIDSNPLSKLLRSLEDPGHTKWLTARIKDELKRKYSNINKLVKFIKKLPFGLIRQMKYPPLNRDLTFLADYFPNISSSETASSVNESGSASKIMSKKDLIKGSTFENFIYKPHKNRDGFTLKLKNTESYPDKITVRTAYGTNKGNAFNNYDERDFKFDKDIKIKTEQGEKISCKQNYVQYSIINKNFSISFTGFDPDRELKINVS